jgi:hypothetical protein
MGRIGHAHHLAHIFQISSCDLITVADSCIYLSGVRKLSLVMSASLPAWGAPEGCPDRVCGVLEQAVNGQPAAWRLPPVTGEVFASIEECERRLVTLGLVEGFDIVVSHSSRRPGNESTAWGCTHRGKKTRNTRKLPERVKRDPEGQVIDAREQDLTNVAQTDCPWSCLLSFKSIGKRGSGTKGWVLTVKNLTHEGHALKKNPFIYQRHRERLPEYQALLALATTHRAAQVPYSTSRRILDVGGDGGLVLTRAEYYRLKKDRSYMRSKDQSLLDSLRFALEAAGFVMRTRTEATTVIRDGEEVPGRKLTQIWFSHPKLLKAAALYVAGSACVIDATFKTNNANLPIIAAVGILPNDTTFPIAFSYTRAEDDESYSFFWQSLKDHWGDETAPPAVVVSDQAPAILNGLEAQFPESHHQICEWHAVEAMKVRFRKDHTHREIVEGIVEKESQEAVSLEDLAWRFIKAETPQDLDDAREALLRRLHDPSRDYIIGTWGPKEQRVCRRWTRLTHNLNLHSSQRSESYHPTLKAQTSGQEPLEESCYKLCRTVLRIIDDMEMNRDEDLRRYSRLAQATVFDDLRMIISNFALTEVAFQWSEICEEAPTRQPTDICECSIFVQFGLPCRHYLYRYYRSSRRIPHTLCHPRWWIANTRPVTNIQWVPSYEPIPEDQLLQPPPQPIFTAQERRITRMREVMNPESRHRYDAQFDRQLSLFFKSMEHMAERRLEVDALPTGDIDPVPRRGTVKKSAHGKAKSRGLTAGEVADRQARQRAKVHAYDEKVRRQRQQREEERRERLPLPTASQDPYNSQISTILVLPKKPQEAEVITSSDESEDGDEEEPPATPPRQNQLPLRTTPTTAERPRRRPSPSPEQSPLRLSDLEPPASTAPPNLGREKRKRKHTARYQEARAHGDIVESQEAHRR